MTIRFFRHCTLISTLLNSRAWLWSIAPGETYIRFVKSSRESVSLTWPPSKSIWSHVLVPPVSFHALRRRPTPCSPASHAGRFTCKEGNHGLDDSASPPGLPLATFSIFVCSFSNFVMIPPFCMCLAPQDNIRIPRPRV